MFAVSFALHHWRNKLLNFPVQTPKQSDEILVFLTRAILYYQLKPVVSVFGCCNDGDGDNDDIAAASILVDMSDQTW